MTKRFEAYFDNHMNDWKVQDNLTLDIYPCVSQKVAEAFTELLNGLYCSDLKLLKSNDFLLKENEQLKSKNRGLQSELQIFKEDVTHSNLQINKLADENEELKKQLLSINQLIDNKIDEFKNGDYGDLSFNTIHMFLDLKQEIGDVE